MNSKTKLFDEVKSVLKETTFQEGLLTFDKQKFDEVDKKLSFIYERYKNPKSLSEQKNENVEQLLPFIENFNEKRFWFVDNNNKIKLNDGEKLVSQDGQSIVVRPGEYLSAGELVLSNTQESMAFVYLYRVAKYTRTNKNLYLNIEGDHAMKIAQKPMIRFYFNLKPNKEGVNSWSKHIQDYLNRYRIPFQLKYPLNLANYKYADSGVLYVSQNHFSLVVNLINEIFLIYKSRPEDAVLNDKIPLFTHKIYPGIGFAEDPYYTDLSFGERRCADIIQVLDTTSVSWDQSGNSFEKAVGAITNKLLDLGYSVEGMFRNPNTGYKYPIFKEIFDEDNVSKKDQKNIHVPLWGNPERSEYLQIAIRYCNDLIEKAIWNPLTEKYLWITYEEKDNKKFHRLINTNEAALIHFLLTSLSNFVADKAIYCSVAEKIEVGAGSKSSTNYADVFLKFVNLNISENSKGITEIKDYFTKILSNKRFKTYERQLQKVYDNINVIAPKLVVKENGYNLPFLNTYGNYEFCPNKEGKLRVALFFLVAYKPETFPEIFKSNSELQEI